MFTSIAKWPLGIAAKEVYTPCRSPNNRMMSPPVLVELIPRLATLHQPFSAGCVACVVVVPFLAMHARMHGATHTHGSAEARCTLAPIDGGIKVDMHIDYC